MEKKTPKGRDSSTHQKVGPTDSHNWNE